MKTIDLCLSALALVTVAFIPGPIQADELEGLDVTMEVIDDISALDVASAEIEARDAGGGQGDVNPEHELVQERDDDREDSEDWPAEELSDGFDHDEDFDDETLDAEDDFEYEEGEAVDTDVYDEPAGAP
jgi:hypothetical protein